MRRVINAIRLYERAVYAEAMECCNNLAVKEEEEALKCYDPLGLAMAFRLVVESEQYPTSRATPFPEFAPTKPEIYDA